MCLPNSNLDIFDVFPRAQSSTSTGNLHAAVFSERNLFFSSLFDRLHSSKYGSETATITNEVLNSQFDIITDIRYTHKTPIYESNLEEKQDCRESSSGNARNEEETIEKMRLQFFCCFTRFHIQTKKQLLTSFLQLFLVDRECLRMNKKIRTTNLDIVCLRTPTQSAISSKNLGAQKLFSTFKTFAHPQKFIFFFFRAKFPFGCQSKLRWKKVRANERETEERNMFRGRGC